MIVLLLGCANVSALYTCAPEAKDCGANTPHLQAVNVKTVKRAYGKDETQFLRDRPDTELASGRDEDRREPNEAAAVARARALIAAQLGDAEFERLRLAGELLQDAQVSAVAFGDLAE